MTTGVSPTKAPAADVIDLDGDGRRYAVRVNGVVRFVGSPEKCRERYAILCPLPDRLRQDGALYRALGR